MLSRAYVGKSQKEMTKRDGAAKRQAVSVAKL